jgi:MFS family permease
LQVRTLLSPWCWKSTAYHDLIDQTPARIMSAAHKSDLDSAYSWGRLGVSMIIATVGSVGMWAIILVLPKVQAEFGVDRAGASFAYTATMVGFGFGSLLIGRLVDRTGIAPVLIGAALSLALGFAGSALTHSLTLFSIFHGLFIGMGSAACFGPLIADVSHWFNKRRGIAVASAACGNYFAGVIWPLVLKGPLESAGWRPVFFGIAITCVVIMIPLAFFLRRRPVEHIMAGGLNTVATKPSDLSPQTLQILLMIAGLGCCLAMSMPQVHIVSYCADLGYGPVVGAQMLSVMLAGGVVSRLASGVLADRIGGIKTLLLGSLLQCLALFLYIPFDALVSLYVVSLVFGLSQGGIVPCYAIIVREYLPAKEAGKRVGMVIMATVWGMAIGGWMSGWIYDMTGSYQAAFINGIVWNLMNIAAMVLVLTKTGSRNDLVSA